MEQWAEIRRRVLVEEVSKRQVLRETGLHWQTLKKVLQHSQPSGYRQAAPREKKKLGPYLGRMESRRGQTLLDSSAPYFPRWQHILAWERTLPPEWQAKTLRSAPRYSPK